ncbi:MAG TPA: hypothetical protein VLH60_02880 [Sedimentisphaerales bacterium]|nr:hypothetical protein [Sedimentisphaerales bacterium]
MAEWEIRKTLGRCFGTGRKIDVREEYYSALVETQEGLERRDYSAEYWQEAHPDIYCYWKTRLPDSQDKKKLFVDDDMLMSFFERLGMEEAADRANLRFCITLILMRKRLLKYESADIEGANEVWTLRVTGRDERVRVINPHLTEDRIEELSGQIGEILQVEL